MARKDNVWTKRRNHASSSMLLYQVIVGYMRKKLKRLNSIRIWREREVKRHWSLKKIEVVPVVVGALGWISKGFSEWMDTLGIKLNVRMVQKSVLLGTARILRKVVDI